jgi:hypothetical protein
MCLLLPPGRKSSLRCRYSVQLIFSIFPFPGHFVSCIASISILYLLISLAISDIFPGASIVLTFHVPSLMVFLFFFPFLFGFFARFLGFVGSVCSSRFVCVVLFFGLSSLLCLLYRFSVFWSLNFSYFHELLLLFVSFPAPIVNFHSLILCSYCGSINSFFLGEVSDVFLNLSLH